MTNFIATLLYTLAKELGLNLFDEKELFNLMKQLFADKSYQINFEIVENDDILLPKFESIRLMYKKCYDMSINGVDLNCVERYKNDFHEIACIGKGTFGSVYRVKSKFDGKEYAVKRIKPQGNIPKDKLLREIKICAQLENINIVRYITAWFEYKRNCLEPYFYIQMQLCEMTLQTGLELMNIEFNQSAEKGVSLTGAFVASELFTEIVSAVDYLHSQKPPVIHRDLKLKNILIEDNLNGTSIKICDFGLATLHDGRSHTDNVGTFEYMAPEIKTMKKYCERADIYSLGVIMKKLFCIEEVNYLDEIQVVKNFTSKLNYNSAIFDVMLAIYRKINIMLRSEPELRHSCKEILADKNEWSVNHKHIKKDKYFQRIQNEFKKNPESLDCNVIHKIVMNKQMSSADVLTYNSLKCKSVLIDELFASAKKLRQNANNFYSNEMNSLLKSSLFRVDQNYLRQHHIKCLNSTVENHNNELIETIKQSYSEFADKLFAKSKLDLKNEIDLMYNKFDCHNKLKSTPTVMIYLGVENLIASVCNSKLEPVLNRSNDKSRLNCIALEGNVQFGNDAKTHYHIGFDQQSIKEFDIKQLLGRDREYFSSEELSKYPFNFVDDQLNIMTTLFDREYILSAETLNALLLLDIKLDAERQFNNEIKNTIIAIPTYFNQRQRNAIKNAAKIAGFGNVSSISEMTAIALTYIDRHKFVKSKLVLFIIANDLNLEASLCRVNSNKIIYKVYQNSYSNNFLNSSIKECENNLLVLKFKKLLNKTLNKANLEQSKISDVVIGGQSCHMRDIKDWASNYFECKPKFNYDHIDIILDGLSLYGRGMIKSSISIQKVSPYALNCSFKSLTGSDYLTFDMLTKNSRLPTRKQISCHFRKSCELPFEITVFQGDYPIYKHIVNELPILKDDHWHKKIIKLNIDDLGEIQIEANIESKSRAFKCALTKNLLENVNDVNNEIKILDELKEKILETRIFR